MSAGFGGGADIRPNRAFDRNKGEAAGRAMGRATARQWFAGKPREGAAYRFGCR